MKPGLPLPPQLIKKRRQNLLFASGVFGILLAVAIFLLIPRSEKPGSKRPNRPAATATGNTTPGWDNAAAQDPFSTPADDSYSDEDDSAATPNNSELSEEELAKLPPWEANFMRLSLEHRLAFATAFTKAKAAYAAEQWANCLALLTDCELIYSGSPNVWNLRSCALLASDAPNEAEPSIKRSLELNPEDNVALMCLSEMLMLRQDYQNSIPVLEKLRHIHLSEENRILHDAFAFHQLLCHLMLGQEMEARALVADYTPLTDSPLYYFAQAAFCVYRGDSEAALEPLRAATTIYGNGGATASYRKWMSKSGLARKYAGKK